MGNNMGNLIEFIGLALCLLIAYIGLDFLGFEKTVIAFLVMIWWKLSVKKKKKKKKDVSTKRSGS